MIIEIASIMISLFIGFCLGSMANSSATRRQIQNGFIVDRGSLYKVTEVPRETFKGE